MRLRTFVLALLASLATVLAVTSANAQRGGEWELLGEQSVGFRVDRDTLEIKQPESWFRTRAFRRLRFAVERADLHIDSIRLTYLNGFAEDIRLDRRIREGEALPVDLPGERSYLKSIDMTYRSAFGLSIGRGGLKVKQALVKIYGELVPRRAAPPARPALPGGWSELDNVSFDSRASSAVFRSTRDNGRIGQIRLRAMSDRVDVRELRIRFRNGQTQSVTVGQLLQPGEMTRPIDLDGDRRRIEQVAVEMSARRRPGNSSLQLLGAARPGRSAPVAAWKEIGKQDFRLNEDRAVLRVGRSAGRVSKIRLSALRESPRIRQLRVQFRNGEIQVVEMNDRVNEGTQTRIIDLTGDERSLETVTVLFEPRRRPRQAELALYGLVHAGPAPAKAVIGRDWVEIGKQTVGFRVDKDVVDVARPNEWYRNRAFGRLHFAAERNDVHMMAIRLVYSNGFAEDYRVDRTIRPGAVLDLDLRGDRSHLSKIEMTYRSRPGFAGQAVLTVYGEPTRDRDIRDRRDTRR